MFWIKILIPVFISRISCRAPVDIRAAMKAHRIIPDVLDNAPEDMIEVMWEDGILADFGNQINMVQTLSEPLMVNWPTGVMGYYTMYYTLLMIDADYEVNQTTNSTDNDHHKRPTRPERPEWRHWLKGNIQGSLILTGQTIDEYVPPYPVDNKGLHRYVFILFLQKRWMTFHEVHRDVNDPHRGNFSTREFMRKYNFSEPVAINFFKADS